MFGDQAFNGIEAQELAGLGNGRNILIAMPGGAIPEKRKKESGVIFQEGKNGAQPRFFIFQGFGNALYHMFKDGRAH
jgi:hypothetical protein